MAWGNGVAYRSQFISPAYRAEHMARKICGRLGNSDAFEEGDAPLRPSGMRLSTYRQFTARYKSYCERATELPLTYHQWAGSVNWSLENSQ